MSGMSVLKSVRGGAMMLGALGFMSTSAHAQSLYEPYYYTTREQYQLMPNTNIRPQHSTTVDVSAQPNYVPDSRLNPQTNKQLAQGEYPPVTSTIAAAPVVPPPSMPLTTISGIQVGIQGEAYQYNEPGLDKNKGGKFGVTAAATQTFGYDSQYFATIDFRYDFGQVDYSGSGTKKNLNDYLGEIRGVVGRDILWQQAAIDFSPYIGFGYRNLFNDLRGITSTGASGYRRNSQYFYIPVGLTPRFRIDGDSRLTGNIEYDYFVHGEQTSDLSDAGLGDPNITNQQDTGYGVRGSIMYENGNWSIGPYFNFWKIQQSATKYALNTQTQTVGGWVEPNNNTAEIGAQLKYRFDPFF